MTLQFSLSPPDDGVLPGEKKPRRWGLLFPLKEKSFKRLYPSPLSSSSSLWGLTVVLDSYFSSSTTTSFFPCIVFLTCFALWIEDHMWAEHANSVSVTTCRGVSGNGGHEMGVLSVFLALTMHVFFGVQRQHKTHFSYRCKRGIMS